MGFLVRGSSVGGGVVVGDGSGYGGSHVISCTGAICLVVEKGRRSRASR